jgi:hypothetical protein
MNTMKENIFQIYKKIKPFDDDEILIHYFPGYLKIFNTCLIPNGKIIAIGDHLLLHIRILILL